MCRTINKVKQIGDGYNIISIGTPSHEVSEKLNEIVENLTFVNYEESKEIIWGIYKYFKSHIKDRVPDEYIMDIGYILTDIFERNGEYDKSVEIANEIINKNQPLPKNATIEYKKKYLNGMIGCAYSIAIVKKESDEKERFLERAELLFKQIRPEFEKFINNKYNGEQNIWFISGLYYSDYGALLLNKGDFYKSNQPHKDYIECYQKAKESHEKALKNRENFLKKADTTAKQEAQLRVGRSKRNIGFASFRLGDYKDAVKCQKEAIKDFEAIGNKEEKYTAVDYLTGGYIAIWESNIDDFLINDFKDCCQKLSILREYYSKGSPRYTTAIQRIDKLKRIMENLSQKDKDNAMNIFVIILE